MGAGACYLIAPASKTARPTVDGAVQMQQFRIDADHSNSYEAWKRIGQPMQPAPMEYAKLEAAGKLAEIAGPKTMRVRNGVAQIRIELPRQAVELLVLTWKL